MHLKNISLTNDGLNIEFQNGAKDCFPYIWLRDHCKDIENWDERSNQRKLFTALVDPNIKIEETKIIEDNKKIEVKWPDMNKSVHYSGDFLYKNSLENISSNSGEALWDKQSINKAELEIKFDELEKNEGFKNLLQTIKTYGFSIINNCPTEMKTVEDIANKIGYVRNSIFGDLWSFESNTEMADSAYTQEELRPHTDGTYNHDAPGLQLLLCCEYEAEGGESIMVDGFKIAQTLRENHGTSYNILSEIDIPGRYFGDGVELIAKRPVFKFRNKKLIQVSFNNYDRGDFRLPNNKINDFYTAIRAFDKLANAKEMQWRQILKPGQLLIFNNWRVLHGRSEFSGKRKMSGCYINKEDFESVCRMNSIY